MAGAGGGEWGSGRCGWWVVATGEEDDGNNFVGGCGGWSDRLGVKI